MKILLGLVLGLLILFAAGGLVTVIVARRIEAQHPPLGRFVPVTGGRLHVVEAGPAGLEPAATVLLLHGASGNSADPMLAVGRRLAERHRVVALDRPGHGWSDRLAGAAMASPAAQARAVVEALDGLGIARAVVVGHSWSGALATSLALDHPERVAALVLLSPVSHPWPGGAISWYYGPATSSWLGWLFTRTVTTPVGLLAMDLMVPAVFAPQAPVPGYAEAARTSLVLRPEVFQANAEDVAGLYAFVSRQSGRYGAIRAPTVIVSGDADRIVWTHLHSRSLAREIPGARLVVLPGVGHMPHHVAPERIIAEIDALAEAAAR